jgi:hypothetical protein
LQEKRKTERMERKIGGGELSGEARVCGEGLDWDFVEGEKVEEVWRGGLGDVCRKGSRTSRALLEKTTRKKSLPLRSEKVRPSGGGLVGFDWSSRRGKELAL